MLAFQLPHSLPRVGQQYTPGYYLHASYGTTIKEHAVPAGIPAAGLCFVGVAVAAAAVTALEAPVGMYAT